MLEERQEVESLQEGRKAVRRGGVGESGRSERNAEEGKCWEGGSVGGGEASGKGGRRQGRGQEVGAAAGARGERPKRGRKVVKGNESVGSGCRRESVRSVGR